MDASNQFNNISIIDVYENSAGFNQEARAGRVVSLRAAPPFWAVVANGGTSSVSFLSQALVILIAKGLEGDYSAKTLMWVQATFESLKRVHNVLMATQRYIREYDDTFAPQTFANLTTSKIREFT